MKCKYCSSNIDIDTAVCPYCGKENPVAKKHREDMEKYSDDYNATKEDVMRSSKRFNSRTFRITVVAVTFAALAIMICLIAFNQALGRTISQIKKDKESGKYAQQIINLVEQDDYLELNRLIESEDISYYAIPELSDSYEVIYIARYYSRIFGELMEASTANGTSSPYAVSNINEDLKWIYQYSSQQKDNEMYTKYCNDAKRDVALLLEYYLDIPREKAVALESMSDGQRITILEEAYYAKIEK